MSRMERWLRDQRRHERSGPPDELHLRSYANIEGEQRYLLEARRLGLHAGERTFAAYEDALAFANMMAAWECAALFDHVGERR